jgi:hypothetical protein
LKRKGPRTNKTDGKIYGKRAMNKSALALGNYVQQSNAIAYFSQLAVKDFVHAGAGSVIPLNCLLIFSIYDMSAERSYAG